MDSPNSILLFAAGLGTRMAPLTDSMPKPLVKVAGQPLLEHALRIVETADVPTVVINTHCFSEQIKAYTKGRIVLISDESDRLLDTGGGLKKALPLLTSNPAMTMNTDAIWTGSNPIKTLLQSWDPLHFEAALLLVPIANATGHRGEGDFDLQRGDRITTGRGYVYSGLQIIRTDLMDEINEDVFSMWRLWQDMLDRGRVQGIVHLGGWCDVGYPEAIPLAEDLLKRGGHV